MRVTSILIAGVILIVLFFVFQGGLGGSGGGKSFQNISPKEAKERMEKEPGIILLDVRTVPEHEALHIPGSLLIPLHVLEKEAPTKIPDKDAVIFVYCRSGNRSVDAARILVRLGYTQIYNLGGIIDWPYETQSS